MRQQFGENPNQISLVGETVHIVGKTSHVHPVYGTKNRPYTDVIFLAGELQLTSTAPETDQNRRRTFDMGKVVGLIIVTETEEYTVWPAQPKDEVNRTVPTA